MKLGKQFVTIASLIRQNWLETEMRVRINEAKVQQYANEMKDGDNFPDPVVFIDPKEEVYRVGDGFHRILARKSNGDKDIAVDLRRGGFLDACLYNIGENKKQLGLPMSTGDKARAILVLLTAEGSKDWLFTRVANVVGASVNHVSYVARSHGIGRHNSHKPEKVSERCSKVLAMSEEGYSSKEISEELELPIRTVQGYIRDAAQGRRPEPLNGIRDEADEIICPYCHGTIRVKKVAS